MPYDILAHKPHQKPNRFIAQMKLLFIHIQAKMSAALENCLVLHFFVGSTLSHLIEIVTSIVSINFVCRGLKTIWAHYLGNVKRQTARLEFFTTYSHNTHTLTQ